MKENPINKTFISFLIAQGADVNVSYGISPIIIAA
jgi:hypothetical protein